MREKSIKTFNMKKLILSLILALFLFSGCKPTERIVIQTVEVPRIEIRVDSVLVQRTDSFVQYQKGDTIYFEKYKTLYRDRIKLRTDTVSRIVEVPVEVEKIKVVEKLRTDWIWWIGIVSLIGIAIFAFIKLRKLFLP